MFALLALVQFSPPKAWVYLCLGIMPFAARLLPRAHAPDIRRKGAPVLVGALVMALHVLAGVSGAVLDMFFLARDLDRRLVVATKADDPEPRPCASSSSTSPLWRCAPLPVEPRHDLAARSTCRSGSMRWRPALAICGTTLAKPVLHRFSNEAFQLWSRRLVLGDRRRSTWCRAASPAH